MGVFIAIGGLIADTAYTVVSSDKDKKLKAIGLAIIALIIFFGIVLPFLLA